MSVNEQHTDEEHKQEMDGALERAGDGRTEEMLILEADVTEGSEEDARYCRA